MISSKAITVFIVLYSLIFSIALMHEPSALADCGKERWMVKIGTDKDVSKVVSTPVATNIANLSSIGAPVNPNVRWESSALIC